MKIYFDKGTAARHDGDKYIKPKFGRCWFFYFPHVQWNNGLPIRDCVTAVSLHWLFYWIGITVYWGTYTKTIQDNPACLKAGEEKRK